jgi:hypothetical protein
MVMPEPSIRKISGPLSALKQFSRKSKDCGSE